MSRDRFGEPVADELDELEVALQEVSAARVRVEAARRAVAEHKAPASSLSTAEWILHQALRKHDRLLARADFADGKGRGA